MHMHATKPARPNSPSTHPHPGNDDEALTPVLDLSHPSLCLLLLAHARERMETGVTAQHGRRIGRCCLWRGMRCSCSSIPLRMRGRLGMRGERAGRQFLWRVRPLVRHRRVSPRGHVGLTSVGPLAVHYSREPHLRPRRARPKPRLKRLPRLTEQQPHDHRTNPRPSLPPTNQPRPTTFRTRLRSRPRCWQ